MASLSIGNSATVDEAPAILHDRIASSSVLEQTYQTFVTARTSSGYVCLVLAVCKVKSACMRRRQAGLSAILTTRHLQQL